MINYCGFYKTASENRFNFNQIQGMSLESLANKNDRNCSKFYGYEAISNVSYMSRLKEISESQLIGNK